MIVSNSFAQEKCVTPDFVLCAEAPPNSSEVTSSCVTVFTTSSYVPGQTIAFNGIEVQVSGNPLPGDEFELTPEEEISIFDTLKAALSWMNSPTIDGVQHAVDYKEILSQLDSSMNHLTSRRADAGVRLQLIESQDNSHADREISMAKAQSNLEDLDMAKAISNFEQSKVALQAAQQSFIQIKNLSLFKFSKPSVLN